LKIEVVAELVAERVEERAERGVFIQRRIAGRNCMARLRQPKSRVAASN
jgi:hypothetical protein